ncbi:MAG: cyclic nucleotide-binding domain-containing protein [Polyangiaceae bacterium]|jgi:hypothetical protein
MPGIPPVIPTDAEDVAWALQTADTLWKRAEHVDAIVWLRRAAQSAAEAEDDDRALVLARQAAELAEWSAHQAYSAPTQKKARHPSVEIVPEDDDDDEDPTRQTFPDGLIEADDIVVEVSANVDSADEAPISMELDDEPVTAERHVSPSASPDREVAVVPTAAEKHAGLLDPWAADAGLPPPRQSSRPPLSAGPGAPLNGVGEDIVTSARVPSPSSGPARAASSSPGPTSAAMAVARRLERPVDLSVIEAFSDMPADLRERFARSARAVSVPSGGDCADFVLAVVVEGTFDVSSATGSVPARRVQKLAVVCARGTIEHGTRLRLSAVHDSGKLAIWDGTAAQELVRSCPWVDDDLRADGDLLQATVGLAMGPLGQRLDPVLRAEVASKLKLRALLPGEVLATRGKPVPGLFVIGAGELELQGQGSLPPETLHAGDFLFPHEVLQASPAPTTVRAAPGGALVLFAERGAAQELLVTCPPLLEIFAGM